MTTSTFSDPIYAILAYEDPYVEPLIHSSLARLLPNLTLIPSLSALPSPETNLLQWRQYESLEFDHAAWRASNNMINSYVFRKALIRKHYLSTTISNWLVKHPESCLKQHVKEATAFEVDYAEFLDDALVEAWDLREAMGRNEECDEGEREWWILKPGMSERGQGIRLFATMEQLEGIFEGWDPESDDEDEEGDGAHSDHGSVTATKDRDEDEEDGKGIMTSQLRHFIAQPYIHPPLLFPPPFASADRKFHIRTYVVAVGAMKIFVYKPMLALFAGKTYAPPGSAEVEDVNDELSGHLTNTCLQTGEREGSVHEFWSLPESVTGLSQSGKQEVFAQICNVTGEVFEAAARDMMIHFQPLPHAFEIFGLDYMVDAKGNAWLLEVNSFPDFAQTGGDLKALIQELFDGVVDIAIKPHFGLDEHGLGEKGTDKLVKCRDIDLGRQ